jgi:hypothetical protein
MKEFTGEQFNSDSLDFVGSALAFHALSGDPFTVTYSVDTEPVSVSTNSTATG